MDTCPPRRSLVGRWVGLSGAQAATWVVALAWVIIVPRSIGLAAFGRYVFAFSAYSIAAAVGLFGLDVHVSRAVARGDPPTEVRAGLAAAGIGAVLASVVAASVVAAFAGSVVSVLLGMGFLAQMLGNAGYAVLQGKEQPGVRAGLDVAAKTVFLAGSVVAVSSGVGLVGVSGAFAGGYLLYAAAAWLVVAQRGFLPRADLCARDIRHVMLESAPLGGHLIAQAVYYRADATMLAPIAGVRAAGRYGAAYRLFDTLSFVTTIYGAVISPRLVRAARESPAEARRLLQTSLASMTALGAAAAIGTSVFSGPVVHVLYGNGYGAAVGPLRLLGVALGISFVVTPLAWALVAVDLQSTLARISWTAVAVNVGANLIAIPRWGVTGAAATTILTEVLVLILHWRAVGRSPLALRSSRGASPVMLRPENA